MNLNEAIQILEENNYLVEFGYLSPGQAMLDRMNGYSLDMNGNRYEVSAFNKQDYNMQKLLDNITETVHHDLGYVVKPVKNAICDDTLKFGVIDNNGNKFNVTVKISSYPSGEGNTVSCGNKMYNGTFNRIPYLVSEIIKDLENCDYYYMEGVLKKIAADVQRRLGYVVKPIKGGIGDLSLRCAVINNNGKKFKVTVNCKPHRCYISCDKLEYGCEFNRIPYMVSKIVKDLEKKV